MKKVDWEENWLIKKVNWWKISINKENKWIKKVDWIESWLIKKIDWWRKMIGKESWLR